MPREKLQAIMKYQNGMRPVHPGEVLREDYLVPLGMSGGALAKALHVPATRVAEILRERRAVTADTAIRLARYFGGDAQSWLNLQAAFELRQAENTAEESIYHHVMPRERAPVTAS
jgi:addiction module HigA family antidote